MKRYRHVCASSEFTRRDVAARIAQQFNNDPQIQSVKTETDNDGNPLIVLRSVDGREVWINVLYNPFD